MRVFVLGVMLVAAVGWCMVQETIKQVRARYELADLTRREKEARETLEKLRTEEDSLRSPARIASLVREKRLKLVSLGRAEPEPPDWDGGEAGRRPGVVLDQAYPGAKKPVRVALAERQGR